VANDEPGHDAELKTMLRRDSKNTAPSHRVKLFRIGSHQSVTIPREFELSGDTAVMRKDGARLVIEPVTFPSLLAVLATLEPIDDEFHAIRRQADS
jgi:antitoxin VapB